jgi:hypothetical protein
LQRLQSLMNRLEAPVGPFEEELWRELRPDSVAPTPGGAPVALPGMKVPGGRHRPLP